MGVAGIWGRLRERAAVHLLPNSLLDDPACNFHEVAFRA